MFQLWHFIIISLSICLPRANCWVKTSFLKIGHVTSHFLLLKNSIFLNVSTLLTISVQILIILFQTPKGMSPIPTMLTSQRGRQCWFLVCLHGWDGFLDPEPMWDPEPMNWGWAWFRVQTLTAQLSWWYSAEWLSMSRLCFVWPSVLSGYFLKLLQC